MLRGREFASGMDLGLGMENGCDPMKMTGQMDSGHEGSLTAFPSVVGEPFKKHDQFFYIYKSPYNLLFQVSSTMLM